MNKLVITIDGPGGAGKSTISKKLARNLGCFYLDTGALYRALAYHLEQNGIGKSSCETKILKILEQTSMDIEIKEDAQRVIVNGKDVTGMIRNERVGILASNISTLKSVRSFLLPIQRDFGKQGGIVAEGRDMGTVVFPNADIKFYLDASLEERAMRRYRELLEKGEIVSMEEVKKDIIMRDRQDGQRTIAPLVLAPDAIVIDSTNKSIDEVLSIMMNIISDRFPDVLARTDR